MRGSLRAAGGRLGRAVRRVVGFGLVLVALLVASEAQAYYFGGLWIHDNAAIPGRVYIDPNVSLYVAPNFTNGTDEYVEAGLREVAPGDVIHVSTDAGIAEWTVTSIGDGGNHVIFYGYFSSSSVPAPSNGSQVYLWFSNEAAPPEGWNHAADPDPPEESEVATLLAELNLYAQSMLAAIAAQERKLVFLLEAIAIAVSLLWGGWFWRMVMQAKNSRRIF